jgi:antitoxin component YwqK of YwqJK toxin-antitoxin module
MSKRGYIMSQTGHIALRQKWFKNGTLKEESEFIGRRRNGTHREWYSNGNRRFACHKVNGKLHGLYQSWYQDDVPESRCTYVNGKKTWFVPAMV